MNPSRSVVDVHVLQTLPPSCLNRDDTNSPKSALYGGARRARVSSQSWKRATRRYFNEQLEGGRAGLRTRKLGEHLAGLLRERLAASSPVDDATVVTLVNEALGALLGLEGEKLKKRRQRESVEDLEYALFIGASAIEAAVDQLAVAAAGGELDLVALKEAMGHAHSLDVALFGRMVADTPALNVDAACQVAHAISTHRVSTEFDFYTTVDDLARDDESGAAMMGFVEFNSATLYRFATVSLGRLADNLGDRGAVAGGARAFVDGFVRSLPTGHQNTFAAFSLPELVLVSVRDDQPVSLVGAFEQPVESSHGHVVESARRLATYADQIDELYGLSRAVAWASYLPSLETVEDRLGASVPFPELLTSLEADIAERIG